VAAQQKFDRLCQLYSTKRDFFTALGSDPEIIGGPRLLEHVSKLFKKYDSYAANNMAWKIASKPGRPAEDYQPALHEAECAANVAPDATEPINTLVHCHAFNLG